MLDFHFPHRPGTTPLSRSDMLAANATSRIGLYHAPVCESCIVAIAITIQYRLNKIKVEIHHASSEKDRRNFELFAGRETAKKTSVWV